MAKCPGLMVDPLDLKTLTLLFFYLTPIYGRKDPYLWGRSMQQSSQKSDSPQLVFVTGLSGAGRSSALKVFEDSGFESIDNFPLSLTEAYLALHRDSEEPRSLAIGVDVRTRFFDALTFKKILEKLKQHPMYQTKVLYMVCDEENLLRRYSESRRRHPISADTLSDSIQKEKEILEDIKALADIEIDTSSYSPPILRQHLQHIFLKEVHSSLAITVTSFSYREGLPKNSDIVFDARFLKNPYYEKNLQESTGLDTNVEQYLQSQPIWKEVFPSIQTLIYHSLLGFKEVGRSYVGIACGCTGGRHRSVFMANQMASWLARLDENVLTIHRDLVHYNTLGG